MDELKPKKSTFFRDVIDFIFGLENKRGEVLDHWITFFDTYSLPPQEFYERIEKEFEARQVPTMNMSREVFHQGGLLSDKRIYLRLIRERLVIDTCAAPFGVGYFFSCRTVYVPALVRLWHILAGLLMIGLVGILLKPLGPTYALIATAALPFAIAGVMRNAAASAIGDLDTFLLKIPILCTFYENWFREETYYRTDTRMVYLQRVPTIIREVAEDMAAAKGVKLVDSYDRSPIFGDLYKKRRRGAGAAWIDPEVLRTQPLARE